MASVRRYEKGGRLAEQLHSLEKEVVAKAIATEKRIVEILCG